jgi:hypothetical protein
MNNYNICTVDNYNVKNITVSKPYSVNDNTYVFNIKYMKNVCLIQTPISIIPYSYSLYDNNSFRFDIVTDISAVYKMLDDICLLISNKINKYNSKYLHKRNIKNICNKVDDKRYKLSLMNKDANNIYTFNSRQEPISLTTLHTFDKVICLFELKRLVLKNDKGFWQTNLLQIKKCSNTIQPSFAHCLIVTNTNETSGDNDRFACYLKMLHMKIPLEAIRHKMLMDGLTENDFNIWSETVNTQTGTAPRPPPLPPPPPPPLLQLNKNKLSHKSKSINDDGGPEFLKDITSGNFQLRKTNDIKQKVLSTVPKDYAPPSLSDIRSALSKLKKVTI